MTVSTSSPKISYAGNGSTTVFAFPFRIFAAADLRVVLRASSGTETVKTLTTDYTVSASPWTTGGSIEMVTPPASGETLLLKFYGDPTQNIDYTEGDLFPAETHEAALDKLTMLIQRMLEESGRTVTLQEVTALTSLVLPDPTSGYVLYSPDGVSLAWGRAGDLGGSVVLPLGISDGGTGANTAAAARAALAVLALAGGTLTGDLTLAAAPTADLHAATKLYVDGRRLGVNRITNGDHRIDQRNNGSAVTVNSTATFYGPDMWRGTGQAADGVFTIARSTATPPAGFTHFLRATVTTADAAIGAGQAYAMSAPLEGSNMFDLGFGASGAKTVTLSFWARSSLTGTFSGSLTNAAANRCYPFSFTISAANTWEFKTVTIAGDTTGTWPTDTSRWGSLWFDLGAGTSIRAAAGAWTATSGVIGVTGATSLIATNGATLDIGGVQLEQGSVATDFERLSVQEAEARCARYYQRYVAGEAVDRQLAPYAAQYTTYGLAAVGLLAYVELATPMRASPTGARIGSWTLSNVTGQPGITAQNRSSIAFTGNSVTATGSAAASPGAGTGYDLSAEMA